MNKISKDDVSPAAVPFGWPAGGIGADALRAFWEQSQAMTAVLVDLNQEIAGFAQTRFSHGSEMVGRMAQCSNLPQAWAAEAEWWRTTWDDYAAEVQRLAALNSRLFGCLLQPSPGAGTAVPA